MHPRTIIEPPPCLSHPSSAPHAPTLRSRRVPEDGRVEYPGVVPCSTTKKKNHDTADRITLPRAPPSSARSMKTVSLFSGIGGLDLGLEDAGHEIIMQVESDPHCVQVPRASAPTPVVVFFSGNLSFFSCLTAPVNLTSSPQVLQHHFPGRELHRDVANVHDLPLETELLVAGFPCPVRPQPLSFVPVSTIFLGREDVARRKRRTHRDDVSYPRRLLSAHPPTARQSPPK